MTYKQMKNQSLSSKKVKKNLNAEKRKKHNEVEKRSRLFRKRLIDKLQPKIRNLNFGGSDEMRSGTIEQVLENSVHFIESIFNNLEIADFDEQISNILRNPNLIACNNNKNNKNNIYNNN
ncbi:hypothetical protein ACTFIU_002453 [Dictyostelium citrinum]